MLTPNPPYLSVLDVAAVGPGIAATQALAWTTEVARTAESLGFLRLWVAEHHGVPDIGSSAPAVLVAHLAARTRTLRVGSGGVMLPNHAALVVAEQFATLAALHPGRIDLGIGRSKGTDEVTAQALGRLPDGGEPGPFSEQLDQLAGFLDGGLPAGHRFAGVRLSPKTDPPALFLLGSGVESARMAGSRGWGFAFANHLVPELTATALEAYRASFRPCASRQEPHAIATALVVCAATQDEAERAAVGAAAVRVRRRLAGPNASSLTPAELLSPEFTEEEALGVTQGLSGGRALVGTPRSVGADLSSLHRASGADELMLCPLEFDGPARIRSLTLVAQALPEAVRRPRS
ncbi:MsnO8 family LLM class oxidoreductase [Kitasatospora sp. NPDC093102]|uniref:MsnO8 family LLM class oxidoreductase n=1 Tax=Kitasatospora sp. NPDC093102 TaxID=3155069 RepID=UPI0034331C69